MTLGALNVIQIILGGFLIALILLQSKGNSFSGAMGGGENNTIFRTRRGFELRLFQSTIVFAIVFIIISLWASFFK